MKNPVIVDADYGKLEKCVIIHLQQKAHALGIEIISIDDITEMKELLDAPENNINEIITLRNHIPEPEAHLELPSKKQSWQQLNRGRLSKKQRRKL